jgi:N-acyl-D-amino-acid deacylase
MFDLIIRNGYILDGSGQAGYPGDVAVSGDRIAAVGALDAVEAVRIIDADGCVIAPGFIDIHSHSDPTVLANPRVESKIRQGVTTEVTGQCGSSAAPVQGAGKETVRTAYEKHGVKVDWESLQEYRERVEEQGISLNLAPLIGLGTVRMSAMGHDARDANPEELARMQALVRQAMADGAFGVSSGLIYPPGCFTPTTELIELARTAGEQDGIYVSHIRGESDTLLESVAEAIRIGEDADVRVHISHHKAAGKRNWGKIERTLHMMDEARCTGLDIGFDVYPYIAGNTSLATVIPAWAHDGGTEALLSRLRDPGVRSRLTEEIREGIPGWENFAGSAGWENILIGRVESAGNKHLEGVSVAEAALHRGQSPEDTVYDLILEEKGETISIVMFLMCEEDVERVLAHPLATVGSDSGAAAPYGILSAGKPHPRAYGTFPRVLGQYVRERRIMSLPEAVRKMTGASAERMDIRNRGQIRPGYYADLTVFDPETITDRATFSNPHQYPTGIHFVVVNGTVVLEGEEHTGALPGRVLRKNGS